MKLSIIIPVYNEEKTIAAVLAAVDALTLPQTEKEIVIVDDGSRDTTSSEVKKAIKGKKSFVFVEHEKNQGKGAAVQTGLEKATGDYVVIQDADLEYDPKDILKLLTTLQKQKAKIVYGTRLKRLPDFSRDERTIRFLIHYLGNKFLSLVTSVLYGQWITDMETGYKMFPRDVAGKLKLKARSFDFEPEITAKMLKRGFFIVEVPISTNPRGYKEGKKLNTVSDGLQALWTLLRYRFTD